MKCCPSCNRTYADETISFCLADGSLLSAPYDPLKEDAPPPEILPPPTRPALPPTQPPKATIPTIPSLPQHQGFVVTKGDGAASPRNSRPILWIVWAFAAVAIVVGVVLAVRYSLHARNESASASKPQGLSSELNNSPSPSASPNISATNHPTGTVPATRSTPTESKRADKLEADPVLFPPDARLKAATPTPSPAQDYSKIFSAGEVEQKVKIISRPQPVYTEEARKNQIVGNVVLRAVFSSSGQVTNIRAVAGLPGGLTEQAIAAAKQIKFVPAMKDGHSVSMWMELQYNFNLY